MLVEIMRYRYSAKDLCSVHIDKLIDDSPYRDAAKPMNVSWVIAMVDNPDPLLDISAFGSANDCIPRGSGFYISHREQTTGLAYSSLTCSTGVEISIFVQPEYRRKGMATILGALLVKQSLIWGVEPHWDAANPESCVLAEKLGYVPAGTYKAYYLRP